MSDDKANKKKKMQNRKYMMERQIKFGNSE